MEEGFSWNVYNRIETRLRNYKRWNEARLEQARLLDEIVDAMDTLSIPTSGVREKLRDSTQEQLTELLRRLQATTSEAT